MSAACGPLARLGLALHRAARRVRISWLRADLARLEFAAYALAVQPDYPGATTHLAYLLAQAAALRLRIRELEWRA